jgi:hypothetical protein
MMLATEFAGDQVKVMDAAVDETAPQLSLRIGAETIDIVQSPIKNA